MKRSNVLQLLSFIFVLFLFSCSDNGPECVNGVNVDGVCNCIEGWEGTLCDEEAGPACVNGVDIDGVCECLEGWEGELCDVEERAKFIGTWEGTLSGCSIEIPILGEFDIPDLPISLMVENGTMITQVNTTLGMNMGTGTINGDTFTLDPTTMEFDAMGTPVTVTISGVGTLVSETQVNMDLNLEVFGASTICPLELNKV